MRLRAAASTCSARRARHGQGRQSPAAIGHLLSPDVTSRRDRCRDRHGEEGGDHRRDLSRRARTPATISNTAGRPARFGRGVRVTNR